MKIKNIIELAAILLKIQPDLNDPEDRLTKLLVRITNLILGETATDYCPLLTTEKVNAIEGKIGYDMLSKKVIDIKSVTDTLGNRISFRRYPSYISLDAKECKIVYTYHPEFKGLEEDTDYGDEKLSLRTLAYGVAAEYCLISGLYEDAEVWDKRYKDSLVVASRHGSEQVIPKRAWY